MKPIVKPAPLKPSFFFEDEAAVKYKKINFFPKHNLTDSLYSIVDNTYAVVSYNSALIVNCQACPDRAISFVRFLIINNDVSVGLSVDSRDSLKYPIARKSLMMYNFRLNSLKVGISEKSFQNNNNTGQTFAMVVDTKEKKMYIIQQKRVVCSEGFTDNFKAKDVHVILKVGEFGRIQVL